MRACAVRVLWLGGWVGWVCACAVYVCACAVRVPCLRFDVCDHLLACAQICVIVLCLPMCVHVPGAQGNKQAPLTVQCTPGHACACVYVYVTYVRVCYIRVPNCTYACKDPLVCV